MEINIEEQLAGLSREELIKYIELLEVRENMDKFFSWHTNTHGEKLSWDGFEHLKELHDEYIMQKEVILPAGTQLGKSEQLVLFVLAFAAAGKGKNVLFVFPNQKFKDDYVKEKIFRPLSRSDEYKPYLEDSIATSTDMLQFGGGLIKFVSAGVTADMEASFSADLVVFEEVDTYNDKALANIPLAIGRMDASKYKYIRAVSNVKKEAIWEWYKESDMRVRKFQCDTCKEYHPIDFFKSIANVTKDKDTGEVLSTALYDAEWYKGCGRDIQIICPDENCNGHIERDEKRSKWEPTAAGNGSIGYHMPSICRPSLEVSEVWSDYKKAEGNPIKMAAFYFRRLAIPYGAEGNKVSDSLLEKAAYDPEHIFEIDDNEAFDVVDFSEINKGKSELEMLESVMGIDVSPSHVDIIIASIHGTKLKARYIAKIDPNAKLHILELIQRYNVKVGVVDIGPERLWSEWLQEEADCVIWLGNYKGAGTRKAVENSEDEIYTIDRTVALDEAWASIKTKNILLPHNFADILGGVWKDEMTALTVTLKKTASGRDSKSWTGSNNDHSFHAMAFLKMAHKLSFEQIIQADSISIV